MGRYQLECGGEALLARLRQLSQLGFASALGSGSAPRLPHCYPRVEGHSGYGYPLVGSWSRGGFLTQLGSHSESVGHLGSRTHG